MIGKSVKEYPKLKEKYAEYLKSYKKMNGGSEKGATSFGEFYMRQTYHSVYTDARVIALMGYN